MIIAVWIIAICSVARVLQNLWQLYMMHKDTASRENAYGEFINSLKDDDKTFVKKMLDEFNKKIKSGDIDLTQTDDSDDWVKRFTTERALPVNPSHTGIYHVKDEHGNEYVAFFQGKSWFDHHAVLNHLPEDKVYAWKKMDFRLERRYFLTDYDYSDMKFVPKKVTTEGTKSSFRYHMEFTWSEDEPSKNEMYIVRCKGYPIKYLIWYNDGEWYCDADCKEPFVHNVPLEYAEQVNITDTVETTHLI